MNRSRLTIGTLVIAALFALPVIAQEDLSPVLVEQLDALVATTERLRGLETRTPVERAFPTRAETIRFLQDQYADPVVVEQLEDAETFYIALGLLPRDTDLASVYLELLGSQVAGFYNTDTQTMNVIPLTGDAVEELGILDQITFVHEYTHALQDQYYDLTALLENETILNNIDQGLAALSLVEGDATLAMQLYIEEVAARDPLAVLAVLSEALQAGNITMPPGTPEILERELLFPYEQGLIFVSTLAGSGYEAVDAAFAAPPLTAEHILHPETYLNGEMAIEVEITGAPDVLGEGWEQVVDTRMGEFYLTEWLRSGDVSARDAAGAAAGWGGDVLHVYQNGEGAERETAYALRIVWDTAPDGDEFRAAFEQYRANIYPDAVGDECFSGQSGVLCASFSEGYVSIAQAPDETTSFALLARIQ